MRKQRLRKAWSRSQRKWVEVPPCIPGADYNTCVFLLLQHCLPKSPAADMWADLFFKWQKSLIQQHPPSACMHAESCLTLCDPWTVAHQAPLSMVFSRQEYWNGLPFPPPEGLLDPGIEPPFLTSPVLQADSLLLSHWGSTFTILSPWVNLNFPQ